MRQRAKTRVRQEEILKLLKQAGRAMVEELAERLDTTPQTIRKDLTALADDRDALQSEPSDKCVEPSRLLPGDEQ